MRLTDKELSEFADYIPPSKYDMEGSASALADECILLRALVGELTNALLSIINCEGVLKGGCDEDIAWTCPVSKQCGIVLRAKEMIGGAK